MRVLKYNDIALYYGSKRSYNTILKYIPNNKRDMHDFK